VFELDAEAVKNLGLVAVVGEDLPVASVLAVGRDEGFEGEAEFEVEPEVAKFFFGFYPFREEVAIDVGGMCFRVFPLYFIGLCFIRAVQQRNNTVK